MLQANETGRDDQPDGDEELHAQQQRTQPAAAAGSAEGSLDDQRRGERRDIPRRVEAGGDAWEARRRAICNWWYWKTGFPGFASICRIH